MAAWTKRAGRQRYVLEIKLPWKPYERLAFDWKWHRDAWGWAVRHGNGWRSSLRYVEALQEARRLYGSGS